jgi:hypothetical protein
MKRKNKFRSNSIDSRHPDIFNGFNMDHYKMYDRIKKNCSRLSTMKMRLGLWYEKEEVPSQIWALLDLRAKDAYEHIKVWQMMRHRFDPKVGYKEKRKKINQDSNAFWIGKVGGALRRGAGEEWQGTEGKQKMLQYVKNLWDQQKGLCAVSGMQMTTTVGARNNRKNSNAVSIDRINSDLPYQLGNVQLVCWWVNHWKSDMSMTTFIKRIRTIAVHQNFAI